MTGQDDPTSDSRAVRETIAFEDLKPFLLLKNGNYLYKVPFRDGWAVLKVYYGTRGMLSCLGKSFGNVVFHGQTSYMPRTRCRVEQQCLEVWRKHGFRVFKTFPDVRVRAPGCREGGYVLLEYVEAPKLVHFLRDETVPLETRFETYRRFLAEWARRHDLALEHREPMLIHENGDGKHVMILEDELLWFDFEMVYRSPSRIPGLVAREIIQYLWNLMKGMSGELRERLIDETVAGYPSRDRLRAAHDYFLRHPNPVIRAARSIDRLTPRARKPTSKVNVARRLRERLARA